MLLELDGHRDGLSDPYQSLDGLGTTERSTVTPHSLHLAYHSSFHSLYSVGLLDTSLGLERQELPSSNRCRLCRISSAPFLIRTLHSSIRPAKMGSRKRITRTQPANQVLIDKYRRNRKMQSCEPCRKLKVACDHSIPCGRCTRTRRVDKCYYHPNPLTRVSYECLLFTCYGRKRSFRLWIDLTDINVLPESPGGYDAINDGASNNSTYRRRPNTTRAKQCCF